MALSQAEVKLLVDFLEELCVHQGNSSCNDFEMENTSENLKIAKAASPDFFDEKQMTTKKKIYTMNSPIVEYLIKRLKEEYVR